MTHSLAHAVITVAVLVIGAATLAGIVGMVMTPRVRHAFHWRTQSTCGRCRERERLRLKDWTERRRSAR